MSAQKVGSALAPLAVTFALLASLLPTRLPPDQAAATNATDEVPGGAPLTMLCTTGRARSCGFQGQQ
jgi:hypothetical protein